MRRLVLALLFAAGRLQAQAWNARASAEFPFWTAAVGSGFVSEYGPGYGFELATERDLRPGLAGGFQFVSMHKLAPMACAGDTGDNSSSSCGNGLGRSNGVFGSLRQYLPRSSAHAHLVATLGFGFYQFDAHYLGRHVEAAGPTLLYGAEGEVGSVLGLSLVTNVRAQLIFGTSGPPLHVATATLGIRTR